MINIISRSIISNHVTGPRKVVENLIKGLNQLDYPYVINARLDACKRIWIHDDKKALETAIKIEGINIVAGPNLYVTPRQIPERIDLSEVLYIHPSPWVIDLWKQESFKRAKLDYWPTGIDTDIFVISNKKKERVLIYFKERYPEELEYAEKLLTKLNIPFKTIRYSFYNEYDYQSSLSQAKYVLWIGRQESQGIALQEALSTDTPILVWDVKNLGHWRSNPKNEAVFSDSENAFTGATSAYYFDNNCGVIIKEKTELNNAIMYMEKKYTNFAPRKFILENLSLKKQARDFINLYQTHFNLNFEEGLKEKKLQEGDWSNNTKTFKLYQKIKDTVKMIIR